MQFENEEFANIPFGGKVVVFSEDFQQVLPVVSKGSRSETAKQCINWSNIWKYVIKLKLTINIQISKARTQIEATQVEFFTNFLLRIGEGNESTIGNDNETIQLPESIVLKDFNIKTLTDSIFAELSSTFTSCEYLAGHAILTPRNADVKHINNIVLESFPGEKVTYSSINEGLSDENQMSYSSEFLNTYDPPNFPLHDHKLNFGCPVILLRNLDPANSL